MGQQYGNNGGARTLTQVRLIIVPKTRRTSDIVEREIENGIKGRGDIHVRYARMDDGKLAYTIEFDSDDETFQSLANYIENDPDNEVVHDTLPASAAPEPADITHESLLDTETLMKDIESHPLHGGTIPDAHGAREAHYANLLAQEDKVRRYLAANDLLDTAENLQAHRDKPDADPVGPNRREPT